MMEALLRLAERKTVSYWKNVLPQGNKNPATTIFFLEANGVTSTV